MYILLTWKSDQGMVLYINGVLQAVATQPTSTYQPTNVTATGNLVFGKSTQREEADTFTRFQLSLFSVLPTFSPKSESFRMFSYYVGRPITNAFEGEQIIYLLFGWESVVVKSYYIRPIHA